MVEYSYCGQLAGIFYTLLPTKYGMELQVLKFIAFYFIIFNSFFKFTFGLKPSVNFIIYFDFMCFCDFMLNSDLRKVFDAESDFVYGRFGATVENRICFSEKLFPEFTQLRLKRQDLIR